MSYGFSSLFFRPSHRAARGFVDGVVTVMQDVVSYPTSRSSQSIDIQAVLRVARRRNAVISV
jgi:hypothetical protein